VTVPVVRFTVAGHDAQRGLGRPYTVVYDATCRVCTRLAGVLRKWDRDEALEVTPSQAPGVTARFPWIPPRAYAEALQLIGPSGETWQGAAAIEQLIAILPRGKMISWIFKIPLVRTIADKFYRWFARNRYRLGCGEHCQSRPLDVAFRDS
jgi:predicted DCC family thiol-disulfide oxidoreductase YuxK